MIPNVARRRSWPAPALAQHAVAALAAVALLSPASLRAQQAPAAAAPAALTLEQAIDLARSNNPTLQQQKNDVDVARSATRSAVGGLMPQFSAGTGLDYTASGERRFGSVQLAEQPEYYGSSYNLSMNYQLSGSTLYQPSVQRSQERATRRRVAGAEATLDAQVAQQYLAILQAREQVAQGEREVARTGEHVRLAQARLEVGAGTPLDVRRAQVQQGRAQVTLVQARTAAETAVLTLGQLIGVPLPRDVELASQFQIFDPDWQADALVEMALQNNPQLMAARASQDAARTSVKSARTAYLPSVGFNVGMRGSAYQAGNIDPLVADQIAGMEGGFRNCQAQNDIRTRVGLAPAACINPSDPIVQEAVRSQVASANNAFPFKYTRQPLSASMSISLPIFTGFQRQLQVDQAKAQAADAQHAVRAEELRLRQEIGTAVLTLESQYQTVLLQQQVRDNAQEELRLAQERFRFGAASSIEVTDAQATLALAEQDLITAVYTFHRTLATLEASVGRPLR